MSAPFVPRPIGPVSAPTAVDRTPSAGEADDRADDARLFVPAAWVAQVQAENPPAPTDGGASRTLPAALAPLATHLTDPAVTDVFVNGEDGLFLDRGEGVSRVGGWHGSESEVRALAVALIDAGGRHIDDATPCVDVRLDGGIRVHAVLPPISRRGTVISIRLPRPEILDLAALERRGTVDAAGRARLERLVTDRVNVLVTGPTGTGKTTLLGALLGLVPASERIVTVEDVAELRLDHPHHVSLQARQPNIEGAGGIGLDTLVREALRMRPDRLVVGECRGAEVRDLLTALNTGHVGGGTLHANSLADAPARLEALGALAGLDGAALARQAVSALGAVVHLERTPDGRRRVAGIGIPTLRDGLLAVRPEVWT